MRPNVRYEPVYDDSNNPVTMMLAADSNEENDNQRVFLKKCKNLPARNRQIIMLRYFSNKTQAGRKAVKHIAVQVPRLENKI